MVDRAARIRDASDASSSSRSTLDHQLDRSSGVGDTSETNLAHSIDPAHLWEQRRLRHVVSILVRNLVLPDVRPQSLLTTPVRPSVRRSLSVASNHSAQTLQRTPSNRTLRPSNRRRASSVASTHLPVEEEERAWHVYRPPSVFLPWDASSLRRGIHGRMAHVFVSLDRKEDARTLYRTTVSQERGLNHAWGLAGGAEERPDGLDLSCLTETEGCLDALMISLWAATERDEHVDPGTTIQPGDEEEQGFRLIWQRPVELRRLTKASKDLAAVSSNLPANTVLLGMRYPLATLNDDEAEQDEPETKQTGGLRNDAVKGGGTVELYVVMPTAEMEQDRDALDATVDQPLNRRLIRQLLRQGKMQRGYDVDDILRILQLQRQRHEMVRDIDRLWTSCDAILTQERGMLETILRHGEEEEKLRTLHAQREAQREDIIRRQHQVQERQRMLQMRKARLEIARRLANSRKAEYADLERKMQQLAKLRDGIEVKIYARRVTLLRQVEFIYPIELVDGAQLLFDINGIPLANREGPDDDRRRPTEKRGVHQVEQSDEIVSSALGMVGQMIALISAYTDTPLHYPIATAGSRSVIQDGISVMSGPRAFPLYAKGVERYRFDYGHFLLNKNIEQLMNHAGITILDIRNTLANLKNLIVTLTASDRANSKLSRRTHVGAEVISLPFSGRTASASTNGLAPPVDGINGTRQIGYGAVVEQQLDGSTVSAASRRSTASSRWGMSLLGWGTPADSIPSRGQLTATTHKLGSALPASSGTKAVPPPSRLPTVRTLGKQR